MPARAPVGGRLGDGRLGRQDQTVRDDAVEERDQQNDDEGELDHFRPALVLASPPQLFEYSTFAFPTWTPSSVFWRRANWSWLEAICRRVIRPT